MVAHSISDANRLYSKLSSSLCIGSGMPYRVEQGRAQTHKGTGLGLAIVKHIVTLHKGRLSIVSDVGKGACFSFLLQAAGNGSARDAVAGRNSGTASGQDISRETAGMMPGGQ